MKAIKQKKGDISDKIKKNCSIEHSCTSFQHVENEIRVRQVCQLLN